MAQLNLLKRPWSSRQAAVGRPSRGSKEASRGAPGQTPPASKGSIFGYLHVPLGDPFRGVPAGPVSLDRACVVSLSARRRPLTSRVRGVVGGFRVF